MPQATTESCCEPPALPILAREVEADLARRLARFKGPEMLREAMSYAVLGGGKRLRPVLTLLCCEAAGGDRGRARDAAAALELVHTFSLIHDDLPAMDDDDLRRGRATLHIHAGEAMAVLAGDALMSLAFEWVAGTDHDGLTAGRLVRELADATTRMISGQVYDTLGGLPCEYDSGQKLDVIHRNKTAALIRAACTMGAICAGPPPRILDAFADYGEAAGLMFQIVDDLLDVTQSAEHIGKATGKDGPAGKLTYPGVHGDDASRQAVELLRQEAHAALKPLGQAGQVLRELCDFMAVRTK
ncbi:MAG: polyprenyl synthetase family protein [Planctomycetota bacterium]